MNLRSIFDIKLRKVVVFLACTSLASCQLSRFVFYNFADINDYKKFPSRGLTADSTPFQFFVAEKPKAPKEINGVAFDDYLSDNNTVAFLIIQNDSIHYENYFSNYDSSDIVPSFSMSKSIVSMLIGCALDDGLIDSVSEPITNYIPELREGMEFVTIEHLLQMTSGIEFNESYFNPFGDAAAFYYGRKLRKKMRKMKAASLPGAKFEYISGNTQLLGLVLERALKTKTITEYLQEKIWTPLEMEFDASWSIDRKKNGIEKTFCCLNARARDFAKLGRLYLKDGNWNGTQIVSKEWVEQSTISDVSNGSVPYYQYQWWMPNPGEDFLASGFLGQYIYVHPAKNLIIVRLGKNEGKADWWTIFSSLAQAY